MSLERLKWLTIVLPIAFLAFAQAITMFLLEPVLGNEAGHWVVVGILTAGVIPFATVVFKILSSMQQRIVRGERHLAVLEERERLSREMHDSLAQVLGYLHLKAQAARDSVERQALDRASQELNDMSSLAHEAYLDVREAILGLRETVSSTRSLVATLREYLPKFSRQANIEATLEVEGDEAPQCSPEAEIQLVRVIQEALTNVRKHADADRVWVRIMSHNDQVTICVEDNGQGFDVARLPDEGHRFGMRTMRERVERVGGRLEIEASPGHGTKVYIWFPLAKGEVQ